MKLIKISDKEYIIVEHSETVENDWVYDVDAKYIRQLVFKHNETEFDLKITHSTDIKFNEVYYIPLEEVNELLGIVDIHKKANEWYNKAKYSSAFIADHYSYEAGYNQSIEDNKDKKYTEEDLEKAYFTGAANCHVKCTERDWRGREIKVSITPLIDLYTKYIQTLQPKIETEWEVEFVDGKLKLIKDGKK